MRLRRALEDLTGRSRNHLVPMLLAQVESARQGTLLAARMCTGAVSTSDSRRRMASIEHEGDRHRAAVVTELAAALVTPLDREDLYRFSRSVDNVLDNLRDFVRESDLYAVNLDGFEGLITAVTDGLDHLRTAVERVPQRPSEVSAAALQARKSAGRVRQAYQLEMAALLNEQVTATTLKRRELLRRLDVVGLRLSESADTLADGVLKCSH
jgi:uncharacterized protein